MRPIALSLFAASCFYVTESERRERFDLDGDGVERPFDCDDDDGAVGETVTRFADIDGDGFGDPEAPVAACGPAPGTVEDDSDCDDANELAFPGAPDRCDDEDNDCDGLIDEDQSDLDWYRDADGDGFGDPGSSIEACRAPDQHVANDRDCDDRDELVNPDGIEVCGGEDEDCDHLIDELDPDLIPDTWFDDVDEDGFGAGTGVDACEPPVVGMVDVDGDCAPLDDTVHPDAVEICNTIDDDCDDDIDGGAVDARRYYADTDGDGFGDAGASVFACPPPAAGLVPNASDCDDGRDDVYPNAPECDDGVDNDCDAPNVGGPC